MAQHDQGPRSRRAVLGGMTALALAGAGTAITLLTQPAAAVQTWPAGLALCRSRRRLAAAENARLSERTRLRLAWNANAVCESPIALAAQGGIYDRYNLEVELVNFAGSTDQLLEAIATGKAEAGVGMIFRWLKALEQGFDVKLVGGTHGGCIRMVGSRKAGVTELAALRGKVIAVSDMASPARNAFAIMLQEAGIDPNVDVEWRAFPAQLLGVAVEKGEAQAIADADPNLFLIEKRSGADLAPLLDNMSGPYEGKTCCVIGVEGELVRSRRPVAAALAQALLDASEATARDPAATAAAFAPYTPASPEDVETILRSMAYHAHPTGDGFVAQIAFYAEKLKRAGIMKPGTDPAKLAARICEDVLA